MRIMSFLALRSTLSFRSAGLLIGALLCWLLQYGSVQYAAGQVAALFQAAIAVAWSMLLLWLWTRWRGLALFAQGAALGSALWGGVLFTVQWACLYLAADQMALWRVAMLFLLPAGGFLALLQPSWGAEARRWRLGGIVAAGLALLGVWAGVSGQGGAALLSVLAALAFALGFQQRRCARMRPQELMRWRFYQLCVAALLLPLAAVAFSPSWTFVPGGDALAAILLQTMCGGLAFPFLLAAASPDTRNEAPGDAPVSNIVGPDA